MPQEDRERLAEHKSVPLCWIETEQGVTKGVGGRDRLCEWIQGQQSFLLENDAIKGMVTTDPNVPSELFADTSPGTANQI